ncbi:MAG: SusC/RagA family TonB-linked outer membrane protein [Prolixibacteraceae bacterium]|nr:SusC/RagA family TonB-linked outer membrane protein [Prolixibacteraceae bacterium]MDI9562593.1 SusC/RagA family TonB-linked outer membrane protein [Bacteroidota bacterium]NLT00220.1 SusC/RagA family TonB-linked outer membrane protein [Bacteroidales bacterium]OQB80497.1 MAG: TonB-dependent Receptor Plug Domain protein [Bacteroidetes bacterium ADurb.Bin123]HNZ69324.1 SusC/RagA family TonB-linked outer membrane protein [Prolixibacteraceae bacterium]
MKLKLVAAILLFYLLIPFMSVGQSTRTERVVRGTVTSATDGQTLPGTTVIEADDNKRIITATITDINGQYVLRIKNPANNIAFSFVGYITQGQKIGDQTLINVTLKEETQVIEGIVVTAEKKVSDGAFEIPLREVSTAVQTISAKEFEGIQVTSIDEAMQGRIAGLDIVANSGDLGSGATMTIRGTSSINANTQPLIVVNGIPYEIQIDPSFDFAAANQEQYANMLSINPDDIEEITVLKDASSTAVWGSKGANGILVIKTKKGATGPTRVQYSYRFTGARQPKGMNMLNGDDYSMMIKQAYFNPQQDENAANVREFLYDPTFSEYENFNNNTDWVDEVTKTGFKHDHYLNISGGGQRARYRVSGGFLTQTGTVIGQMLNRITTTASLDYSVSDRIKFISELSFFFTDNNRNYDNILGISYRKMPNVSVYQQNLNGENTNVYYNISRSSSLHGSQRDLRNPVALANLATNNLKNYRIRPTFRLQYDLLDPEIQTLKYNLDVSFDVNNDKVSKFLPAEVSNAPWNDGAKNFAESFDSESVTVLVDNGINWQPRFQNTDHSLLLQGSFQIITGNSASQGIGVTNLPSGDIVDASSYGYSTGISTSRFEYRSNAFTFRGHYTFKDRYILGLTFRRDGSTKFGEKYKYGNFPGISAKWIITDEEFMQSTKKWLSMLAIRPSWGITGNQPGAEYLHFSRYSPYGSYMDMPATRPTTLRLSDLRWEKSTSYNLGFDLGFFNDRLVFDLNFYNKLTEDLLFANLGVPSSSGFSSVPYQNVGIMQNNGWELNFTTNKAIGGKDFAVDFNFNLSNYVNKIIELRDDILANYNADYDYTNGTYLSRIQEGNSYGSIYGFRYKGVYQYNDYIPEKQESAPVARDENGYVFTDEEGNPLPMYFAYGKSNEYRFRGGDAIYEDINKDGSIDELDIVYLGNSNPKVNGGFGSTVRYKRFSVTAFFNFRYGNKIVNMARMNAENMYYLNNQSISVNWRWRKDGDVTDMPRALYNHGYNWLGSDRYVEEGSFLRMKYLTFNYSIPKEKLLKLKMQQVSFYLTINNLWVLTKYTGVDPEVGYGSFGVSVDNSPTPRSKDATLGVSLTF